jgi:hypothetical protein
MMLGLPWLKDFHPSQQQTSMKMKEQRQSKSNLMNPTKCWKILPPILNQCT